jgi:hypothetical protein
MDTVKIDYNQVGHYQNLVIMNIFLIQIGLFSTHINPIKINPGLKQKITCLELLYYNLQITLFQDFAQNEGKK